MITEVTLDYQLVELVTFYTISHLDYRILTYALRACAATYIKQICLVNIKYAIVCFFDKFNNFDGNKL